LLIAETSGPLGTTDEISEHLFIGSTSIEPQLADRFKQILLDLSQQNLMTRAVLGSSVETVGGLR
jgi:hypothetical protein